MSGIVEQTDGAIFVYIVWACFIDKPFFIMYNLLLQYKFFESVIILYENRTK